MTRYRCGICDRNVRAELTALVDGMRPDPRGGQRRLRRRVCRDCTIERLDEFLTRDEDEIDSPYVAWSQAISEFGLAPMETDR